MIKEISERVFKNGGITRKDINDTICRTLRAMARGKYRDFDSVRMLVEGFGNAKRKRDRAKIAVALGAIGWNGIFNAGNIAKVLIDYEKRDMAVAVAMDKLAHWEASYKANMEDVKVLRLGAKQVLQKKWNVAFNVQAENIKMDIDCGKRKAFYPIGVSGAGNIYAFLKMLLMVRPLLKPRGLKFDYETLYTIKDVWSIGESKIAYGERGYTGAEMLKSDKAFGNYFGFINYALPDEVKEVILDCLQDAIAEVQYDTGHDYEGNSYNSLKYKPIPEKGLWTGARKAA